MKKKLLVLLAVIVVLAVVSVPAFADRVERGGRRVRGVWCYTPNLGDIAEIPNAYKPPDKSFLSVTYDSGWTGTFAGSSKDTGLAVAHGVGPAAVPMSFVGTVSFDSVKVGDASGGLEMDVIGDRPDPASDWRGTWVITGGTGELEGLQGRGPWWGPGWLGNPEECGVIHYTGRIRFEPD